MRTRMTVFVLAVLVCLVVAPVAEAVVLRVLAVETADLDGYVQEVQKGMALQKKLGSPAIVRIWRARFAGTDAGSVVVSVEYPDLATMAADETKLQANAEYKTWLGGLDKLRKIVSDSLYNEIGK